MAKANRQSQRLQIDLQKSEARHENEIREAVTKMSILNQGFAAQMLGVKNKAKKEEKFQHNRVIWKFAKDWLLCKARRTVLSVAAKKQKQILVIKAPEIAEADSTLAAANVLQHFGRVVLATLKMRRMAQAKCAVVISLITAHEQCDTRISVYHVDDSMMTLQLSDFFGECSQLRNYIFMGNHLLKISRKLSEKALSDDN